MTPEYLEHIKRVCKDADTLDSRINRLQRAIRVGEGCKQLQIRFDEFAMEADEEEYYSSHCARTDGLDDIAEEIRESILEVLRVRLAVLKGQYNRLEVEPPAFAGLETVDEG